jgi:quercetin dioxygenase-like cupin family protein
MINRRLLLGSLGAALAEAVTSRAQTNPTIFEHDLPDVSMKNWSVHVNEINYKPGAVSQPHSHPGITLVYVLEGEIRSQVGNGPEKTYGPGQMFIETPNERHGVSRNASDTKPAKFLAILMAEKGKPLSSPA